MTGGICWRRDAGDLCYLDFGMMSEAPENARYAIIAHVVHLVNRDYEVCPSAGAHYMDLLQHSMGHTCSLGIEKCCGKLQTQQRGLLPTT